MRTAVVLALLGLAAPGCRSIAHSVERMGVEERSIVAEERLWETWNGRAALSIAVEPEPGGIRLRVTAAENGVALVRFTEEVRVTERCARRSVGGIFEAPTSGWAIADDIWVVAALASLGASHATRGEDARLSGALFLLGAAQVAVDAVLFIPWWIGGHDWNGLCDYVGREHPPETRTRDGEVAVTRTVPAAGQEVVARRSGSPARELRCDGEGVVFIPMRDFLAWSRGGSGAFSIEARDGAVRGEARLDPALVLNGPRGTRIDWNAAAGGLPAELGASARLEGRTLVVDVENRGSGDAWQVAVLVVADNADADGRFAALGRLRPGERVQARIELPEGVDQGALELSDAFGLVPGAVPFQR
jgi:hypothetical protein